MYILYCINEEVVVYLKATINNCGYKFYGFGRYIFLPICSVRASCKRHQALKSNTDVDTSESETWWVYSVNTCATNIVSGATNGNECNGGRWSGMNISVAQQCRFHCPHAP